MKLKPLDDRLIVRAIEEEETTASGIVLPDIAKDNPQPLRQIAENSGLEGSVVVSDVPKSDKGLGLNAATGEIVDLVKEGIIDPAVVTRSGSAERGVDRQEHPHDRGHRGPDAGEGFGRRWRRRA
jgi:hypothetical protein